MQNILKTATHINSWQPDWNILIVDDDKDILDALKDLFEMEFDNAKIRTAGSASAAIAVTKEAPPDLVLIDVNLGTVTGLELVSELKKITPDVRCIMMTAHRNIEYATEAISRGVHEYFLKPIDTGELLHSLVHQFSELSKTRTASVVEKKFHIIFDQSEHILITLDKKGQITDTNHTLTKLTGLGKSELTGVPIWLAPWWLDYPGIQEKIYASLEDNKIGYSVRFEVGLVDLNNEEHEFLFNLKPVIDENNKMTQILVDGRDITEQKQSESVLKELAYRDPLTDLANRFSFDLWLHDLILEAENSTEKFALLFIDLDNFKGVNDQYGHQIGDDVLVEVSYELKKCLRDNDFVARLGGDEFTVLLKEDDFKIINRVSGKIAKAINKIKLQNHTDIKVSSSIGIALYPDDGEDAAALMQHADMAMYAAKQAGKNCHQYYSDIA